MAKDQKHDDPEYQARSVALRLLARREHSRYELAIKLRQRRIPPDVFDPVLDEYECEGWLDDDRFAEIYSRQRIEAGYGPLRILAELQQRGVSQTPECLSSVAEEEWCRRAVRARDKRFGLADVQGDLPEKLRQARFLARRGFSSSQSEHALSAGSDDD
ncbi:regulatory protein RecX [Marinobacter nauticus]|uniref:regulatory protein RecX n=1 Tax=Marinobacter nauticus TaxID=2743 RepID=UPI001C9A24E4|nr:regulatory protein RecX [Marinobacter nauticus]MBY5938952.1 recombination regulator RecX [Marinobacter nauticus]MBY5956181.1 recombination regulator RecX [Marinobacter nauticus]MBY6009972.1 recombination regulator RecX [Marinobacter nauticus]